MKKLFFYFLIVVNITVVANSKDSFLLQKRDTITNLTFIKKNYKKGVESLSKDNFTEAHTTFSLGLETAIKLNNKTQIALGNYYFGTYYAKQKNYSEAISYHTISLNLYTELNNKVEIANCYMNLGAVYHAIASYEKALFNYFKSLKISESLQDKKNIAVGLESIGRVYLLTLDLKKAQENFTKALAIYEELNDKTGIVFSLSNLGASYQKEDNILKAIELFKKALPIAQEYNLKIRESVLLGNIGSSYRNIKEYDASLEYLFKALSLKLQLKRFGSAAHSCNDISETYIEIGNLSKAKEYSLKAIEYAKENNLHQERYAYYVLSNIEYSLGNYKSSIKNLKQYHILQDSLFSIDKIASINEMQIKYETEKKNLKIETQESNIALLDAENKVKNQLLLFGSLALLLIFVSVILLKSRNAVKKEKLLQQQFSENLLKSQEEERTRIARELHDSVGQQLTLIKRKSQNENQNEITVLTNNALEEVRSISRGLYPALLKQLGLTESIEQLIHDYDEQTELFFSVDIDNINTYFTESTSLNFYRLIQECLTNIIKHANAKSVTVKIKIENKTIITLISDNGKGFDINDSKKKNSLGLKTIFERTRIMNGNLSIDSKPNNGTSFIFSIPVKNE
ncbi:tetratricopeptide repeat-containing sensor histidine kinase [Polaribacter uvawellassae]|uniref:tetratricopeptide repeat-containing sensor histidine kinase n=1 Tax=Polaribacter uvawellassae TaxID=3133495 RepID=UPI00321C345E